MFENLMIQLKKMFNIEPYGSNLEHYIVTHYPQNVGDVDRLTLEYDRRETQPWI